MKLQNDNWKRVSVGEVVNELRITTDNPVEDGIEYYIGFEHIESENLQVKQFGNIGDGINFNKTFREGDVLFGKIRAYLKKVAVAPFDGLCSGDILVLRTKDKNILSQKMLPYAITTSSFYKLAIDSSIGTTMPRTKWQYISKHTFPLPPLDEQQRIVELFQSIEQGIVHAEGQEANLHWLLQGLINDYTNTISKYRKSSLQKIRFGDVAQNISERIEPKDAIGQIFVGLDHLDPRDITIRRFGKPDDLIGTKLKVYEGDIIFSKRNAYLRKAAIANFTGICSAHAMVIRAIPEQIHRDFLPYFMHSDSFMARAKEISEGSISPTIKWKNLENQEFLVPSINEQKRISELFAQIDQTRNLIRQQKETLKKLKQKLLNEILGG